MTILVGPSKHHVHIQRYLICRHSLFFEHMLRSDNFSESRENVAKLPKDNATSFAVIAEYLYIGEKRGTGAVYKDSHGESRPKSKPHMKTPAADDDDADADKDVSNDADSGDEGEEEEIDAAMEDDKGMVSDLYDYVAVFSLCIG